MFLRAKISNFRDIPAISLSFLYPLEQIADKTGIRQDLEAVFDGNKDFFSLKNINYPK